MLGRVSLTLPASPSAVDLGVDLVRSFTQQAGMAEEDRTRVQTLVAALLQFSVTESYEGRGDGDIELELELDATGVTVNVHDWGKPLRRAGGPYGPMPTGLEVTEELGTGARLINLANEGKRIILHVDAPHPLLLAAQPADGANDGRRLSRAQVEDHLVIRYAEPGDADRISELLWHGYSLLYAHHHFYSPTWLEQALADGSVRSTLAEVDGEVVGHHALIFNGADEAGETGVALIDRAWRGLGLFDLMFERTIARAIESGIPAVFGRASCAHLFSQKGEMKEGYRAAAVELCAIPPAMVQAQLVEGAPPQSRGATVFYTRPLADASQRPIHLPERYRAELERIADHIGIGIAEPDGSLTPLGVTLDSAVDVEDSSSCLSISGPLDDPQGTIDQMLRSEGARKADVVFVDLDLSQPSDIAIEHLRLNGFFLAGLLHAGHAGRDWLRLQRPQADFELDKVQIADETGLWLFDRIQQDLADVS
ncbi:MAG: hypothetical protein EXQ81_11260 [Thermoleophilia bacterium]|nr:hypothetical protein [Thermoleophilia bacterium]